MLTVFLYFNSFGPKIRGLEPFYVEVQGFKDISRQYLSFYKISNWLQGVIDPTKSVYAVSLTPLSLIPQVREEEK